MMNQPALLRLASLLLLLLLVCNTDAKMNIIASKLDVAVGEELFLLCKAGDEGDITWQKDGENIDDDEIVSKVDETSSKLLIKEAKLEDSGKYTCLCAYDSGHRDDVKATVFVYEGPSFGSTTTYHEFLEGSAGVVPCLVSGRPAVLVRWWRERQEFTPEGARVRKLPDNTLRFEAVRREDAGTYTCQAQFRERPIGSQLSVSVVVNAPPKVRLREEVKKVMAGSETNATFVCLVDGLPKPNITWTMPVTFDPSRHQFNSDRSQLTIQSVTRADFGEYICTATNKIAEDSATIVLHVLEAPEVFLSAEQQSVSVGERVSVSCNVSGHPQPELHWLNKHNGRKLIQDSTSGRVRVADGVLVIEDVVPSDGGLYSCMAVSASGNASRDVAIHTQPGLPQHLSASPGPTSVLFSLKIPPVSGGTPITHYVLQWRRGAAEQWSEVKVPAAGPLAVAALKPYTSYTVRLAALNAVGLGQFSDSHSVHTQGVRGEPDSPVVLSDEVKVEGNSVSVPIKQIDDGGTPLLHFIVRYKQDKVGAEWTKLQLSSNTDSVSLRDLAFSSDYKLEMTAVNANGSSLPALFNFTTAEQPVRGSSMTKGSVVGIVMVIFLVLFLVVDATCCYRNRCGLLMTIAVKLFGQKIPGLKMLEEGESNTNGEVTLKSVSTPRGSFQHTGVQTVTKEGGQLKEVTCDKAPLTRHEKAQNIA
ncbi:neural cell adhesion molecule 1 [Betta splendens]|uniref:Neural cell adhesion molecule 1 n=1 Tax=Betta splendens TaxID=158456 RepID=A0A6P7KX66_BETSP|nr:neural cell adhesion molecule 1 [Betta splendens]